ncbi:MAG TPA: pentapeptide repeat-containing protein [Azospirillum sp.]
MEAYDLGKLESSVNATSQRAVAQWVAFLSLWAYLFFTALSITHRDLFLLTPVRLPLIGVDVGLEAFFWAGPSLFWVFHLYMVRKVVLLGRDVAYYHAQISWQILREADREPLYRRMDAFFLTRLLGHAGQGNTLRILDALIAVVTLAVAPLALMLVFQIKFLAFHDVMITYLHRGWLLADLVLVGFLAARALRLRTDAEGPRSIDAIKRRRLLLGLGRTAAGVIALACALFSLFVATVPDEAITRVVRFPDWEEALPRNLEPKDPDFVNDEKLDKVQWTLDLRGRDLRNAELSGADLRKVRLDKAQLQGAKLVEARLQGASLYEVELQGAELNWAQLQGASLYGARLTSASLSRAQLQGALLNRAELQGASLERAELQSASLEWARLQGASLDDARLQGASLYGAELQGASLERAELQGASLDWAELQGASLVGAQLQGTSLDWAQLQGASLDDAQLQGASLYGAEFWLARVSEDTGGDLIDLAVLRRGEPKPPFQPYANDEAQRLVGEWLESIPSNGIRRGEAEKRFARLLHGQPQGADAALQAWWSKVVDVRPDHGDRLAGDLATLACKPSVDNAVAKGIVRRVRAVMGTSDVDRVRFAKHLLKPACEGAKGLSADDRAWLRQVADGKASH